jgi:hypothetical protein
MYVRTYRLTTTGSADDDDISDNDGLGRRRRARPTTMRSGDNDALSRGRTR